MKKTDVFNEKMPPALRSQILSQAELPLSENAKGHRRSVLSWILGAGLTTALASFSVLWVKKNGSDLGRDFEMAQSVDLFEDFQNEEDFELLAEYDLIENMELIDQIEDET